MVAEFVARQSGSPINGETACLNSNSMPASHTMAHGGHDAHGPLHPLSHPAHHGAPPSSIQSSPQSQQNMGPNQQQSHHHQQQSQQHHSHHHHPHHENSQLSPQHSPQQQQQQPQGPPHHQENYNSNFDLRKELFSQRKQREFIPDNKKDDSYWDRRRRNNEAAKRSREKRRFNDMVLEQRVMELSKENHILKAQLDAIREKFGICGETVINTEHVLAALPTEAPISVKRAKIPSTALLYARSPSPVHTSVIHQPVSGGLSSAAATAAGAVGVGARSPRSPAQLYIPETSAYPETESFQYPYPHPAMALNHLDTTSALNLSSRAHRRSGGAQSPYELSSGSGDEASGPSPLVVVGGTGAQNHCNSNNSLPHKLRHKSRIGDKDAASALLALQGIKQEPGARASPPWDNEGSSDERDSGISLGAEWTIPVAANGVVASVVGVPESEREVKSRLDRLASEVASLQSILRLGKTPTDVGLVPAHSSTVTNHPVVINGGP